MVVVDLNRAVAAARIRRRRGLYYDSMSRLYDVSASFRSRR